MSKHNYWTNIILLDITYQISRSLQFRLLVCSCPPDLPGGLRPLIWEDVPLPPSLDSLVLWCADNSGKGSTYTEIRVIIIPKTFVRNTCILYIIWRENYRFDYSSYGIKFWPFPCWFQRVHWIGTPDMFLDAALCLAAGRRVPRWNHISCSRTWPCWAVGGFQCCRSPHRWYESAGSSEVVYHIRNTRYYNDNST